MTNHVKKLIREKGTAKYLSIMESESFDKLSKAVEQMDSNNSVIREQADELVILTAIQFWIYETDSDEFTEEDVNEATTNLHIMVLMENGIRSGHLITLEYGFLTNPKTAKYKISGKGKGYVERLIKK